MLKMRIMPTLLYRDSTLVKGVGFDSWRRVGSLMQAIKVYNLRQVDELVFLDITATNQGRRPDFSLIDDFADECFMPLTVGGGIRSFADVKELLRVGADKVAINTASICDGDIVKKIADSFGSQCVVVSIDVKRDLRTNKYTVWTNSGTVDTGIDPFVHIENVAKCGAGEILLTSIDRDGTMEGYDIELISAASKIVDIPIIASGGAGNYEHMLDAITNGKASAVAAASIFHFTEQTPLEAKQYLRAAGLPTRI